MSALFTFEECLREIQFRKPNLRQIFKSKPVSLLVRIIRSQQNTILAESAEPSTQPSNNITIVIHTRFYHEDAVRRLPNNGSPCQLICTLESYDWEKKELHVKYLLPHKFITALVDPSVSFSLIRTVCCRPPADYWKGLNVVIVLGRLSDFVPSTDRAIPTQIGTAALDVYTTLDLSNDKIRVALTRAQRTDLQSKMPSPDPNKYLMMRIQYMYSTETHHLFKLVDKYHEYDVHEHAPPPTTLHPPPPPFMLPYPLPSNNNNPAQERKSSLDTPTTYIPLPQESAEPSVLEAFYCRKRAPSLINSQQFDSFSLFFSSLISVCASSSSSSLSLSLPLPFSFAPREPRELKSWIESSEYLQKKKAELLREQEEKDQKERANQARMDRVNALKKQYNDTLSQLKRQKENLQATADEDFRRSCAEFQQGIMKLPVRELLRETEEQQGTLITLLTTNISASMFGSVILSPSQNISPYVPLLPVEIQLLRVCLMESAQAALKVVHFGELRAQVNSILQQSTIHQTQQELENLHESRGLETPPQKLLPPPPTSIALGMDIFLSRIDQYLAQQQQFELEREKQRKQFVESNKQTP